MKSDFVTGEHQHKLWGGPLRELRYNLLQDCELGKVALHKGTRPPLLFS